MTAVRGTRHLLPLVLALAACADERPASGAVAPLETRRLAWLGRELRETSGLARSDRNPGVIWSHNDSGHGPILYALDTAGVVVAAVPLPGAANRDWEDLALGPCPAGTCVYVADTGDNRERRGDAAIYRFPEPDLAGGARVEAVERLTFRYPDRPRDVEAMFVASDTSVHLVSKGRRSPVAHYRLPAAAWGGVGPILAQPMPPPPLPGRRGLVTAADVASDGRTVAVLTYREIHRLALEPDGRLASADRPPCTLLGLVPQGEGVAWMNLPGTVVISSEAARGLRAQVGLVRCPWQE